MSTDHESRREARGERQEAKMGTVNRELFSVHHSLFTKNWIKDAKCLALGALSSLNSLDLLNSFNYTRCSILDARYS